jgi:hypothetical protein
VIEDGGVVSGEMKNDHRWQPLQESNKSWCCEVEKSRRRVTFIGVEMGRYYMEIEPAV